MDISSIRGGISSAFRSNFRGRGSPEQALQEAKSKVDDLSKNFAQIDTNKDGSLGADELKSYGIENAPSRLSGVTQDKLGEIKGRIGQAEERIAQFRSGQRTLPEARGASEERLLLDQLLKNSEEPKEVQKEEESGTFQNKLQLYQSELQTSSLLNASA